jgi:hypothetical protein
MKKKLECRMQNAANALSSQPTSVACYSARTARHEEALENYKDIAIGAARLA